MSTPESLVNEIAELKITINALEQRLKEKLDVLEGAIALGELDEYAVGDGSFECHGYGIKRMEKTTYQYSDAVKTLREQEAAEGVATRKVSTYLRFNLPR